MSTVHAAEASPWSSGEFHLGEDQPYVDTSQCKQRSSLVVGLMATPEPVTLCVYERPNWRYALYQRCVNLGYMSSCGNYFLVGIGNDSSLYLVDNMSGGRAPVEVANSDNLIFNTLTMGFTNNHHLTVIKNLPSHLQRTFNGPLGAVQYHLKDNAEQPLIPNSQGEAITTGAVGSSSNGEWLAVEDMNTGLLLVNMKTLGIHWFSSFKVRYGVGSDAHIQFVVSDDGRSVAAFDYNIQPRVYSLSDACVVKTLNYDDTFVAATHSRASCPDDGGRMQDALAARFSTDEIRSMSANRFNPDGDALYFVRYEYGNNPESMDVKMFDTPLYSNGYTPRSPVNYLALGDSYSSGEGDVGNKANNLSYYTPATSQPGDCHISERSYPFLLRDWYDIPINNMHSVACSGAQVVMDYTSRLYSYRGQGNRLAGLTEQDRKTRQQIALEKYSPGQIPQLEFVKKYKPDTITLTGGGNDVGFADILTYCATPTWEGIFVDDTCGYAIEGSPLEKTLYNSINSQYGYTLRLLETIKEYSPKTHVILVGYPSFSADGGAPCAYNAGALNARERNMINKGVRTMNRMLQKAAYEKSVSFVDVETSLYGGRLCEGGKYVNGLHDIGLDNIKNGKMHELFHPNSEGHVKIAGRIKTSNIFKGEVDRVAEAVEYQPPVDSHLSLRRQLIIQEKIEKDTSRIFFSIEPYMFAPRSLVRIMGHSEPTELGSLTASDDGSLSGEVGINDLPVGRHVLMAEGQSYSGEPIQYFQFIEVVASATDSDGDGIGNDEDPCDYIQQWYDEQSGRNICAPVNEHKKNEVMNKIAYESSRDMMTFQKTKGATASSGADTGAYITSSLDIATKRGKLDRAISRHGEIKKIGNNIFNRSKISLPLIILFSGGIIGGIYAVTRYKKKQK